MDNTKYIPLGLFALFAGKLLILGGSYESSLILGVLASTAAYYQFKSNDKIIKDLEAKNNELQSRVQQLEGDFKEVRSFFNSSKLVAAKVGR